MVLHELGLDGVALEVHEPIRAGPGHSIIDGDGPASLDAEGHEDLLGAAVGDGVAEGADGGAGAVDDARALGEVLADLDGGLLVLGRDGLVVLDQVFAVVVLVHDLAAVAWPDDVPVVAVGGVLALREGVTAEGPDALGEVGHLSGEADVPVGVVFEDNDGGDLLLDDSGGEF